MMERYRLKTDHGVREWKAVLQMLDGDNYAS